MDKDGIRLVRLIMIGKCEECGKAHISRFPFQLAYCYCQGNPVEVRLEPALILRPRFQRKLEKALQLSGVAVEELTDGPLKEISTMVLRGLAVERDRGSTRDL